MALADRFVVRLVQFCQPPVLLTGTLAMTGPVVLSSRYWIVPLAVDAGRDPAGHRHAAVVLPKSTVP